MAENRMKKNMYNVSPVDLRTKVRLGDEEEVAIKPYWYYRNGYIHIRYTVDRCVELSESEKARLKVAMSTSFDKQEVLSKEWDFQTRCIDKEIIRDGIVETEKHIRRMNSGHKN